MGLISKVSDKLTGGSHHNEPATGSTTGTHGTSGIGSTTSGTSTSSGTTAGNYGVMNPSHPTAGHGTGSHGTSATHGTSGVGSTKTSTSTSKGADVEGSRLGDLHLKEHDVSSAKGEHTVKHAAPVVAEHVHDRYEHVDKTRVEELREKTEVTQTVQPIYDEVKVGTTRERVDHGLEVHEHGNRGLDSNAEAELARKREQIAKEYRSTHDEETRQKSLRPDVDVHQRVNVVEEVVPVIEKDVYRPHEIEHVKHEVHIHHDRPKVTESTIAKPISVSEYEKASGVKIHNLQSGDHPTRETLTTGGHSHTHGIGGTSDREGNYSSSSSSYETHSTTGTTGDSRTTGDKIKDAVTPGQHATGTHKGTTSTGVPHDRTLGVDQSARDTTSGSNQDARPLMDRLV